MSSHTTPTNRYEVRDVRDATREEWDDWVQNSPGGGHVLQGYEWGEFKRKQGWKPLRLVLERDGEVVGSGQFLLYNTLPVPGYLMYCTKGPWLPWEGTEAVRAFFEGVEEVAVREGVHTVKIEPEVLEDRAELRSLFGKIGFRKARYDLNYSATVVMDLDAPEDELLDRMSGKSKKGKTTRYNINVANRKGVEVIEPGLEDFEWAFDTLYSWIQNLAETKEGFSNRRPRAYFHEMMRRMYDAGCGRFYFSRHEDDLLSGAFVFTFGKKFWFMHGASLPDREKRKLQGTYLLQWEIMRRARAEGMVYADMVGAPKREDRTKDNPYYGSYEFKRGFGGEAVDFVGCLDLPIKPRNAALWYSFEPYYYRLYYKLKNNIFY